MLDVGCDAGQIAIPAAHVNVHFEEGDAEALDFPDASFDLVASLIGAMLAPRPELVAAELIRVCRPPGRIVMANWTPEGFVGQIFKNHREACAASTTDAFAPLVIPFPNHS